MLRTLLVLIHAGAGIGGLIVGLPVLSPGSVTTHRRQWLRRLYAAFVAVLLAAMVALVMLDWPHLAADPRAAFAGLTGLGAVIAYRLVRGHHRRAPSSAAGRGATSTTCSSLTSRCGSGS